MQEADVFLHNFQLGIPEKLGLDYETLSRYNPQLIYAQGSGWGLEGPLQAQPAYAPIIEARSGLVEELSPFKEYPTMQHAALGDVIAAIMLVPGILAALVAREKLGIGQKVEVSGLGSSMTLLMNQLSCFLISGTQLPKFEIEKAPNPLWNHYRCADGKWIILAMLQSDLYWPNFCRAMGIKHLEKDPRFENSETRKQNAPELISILNKIFATRTLSQWLEHFEHHEGEFIYGPIQSLPELLTDPQVLANEYIIDFNHPVHGPIKLVGFPYKLSRTPASMRGAAPEFGQHTEEVLLQMGHEWEDIAQLRQEEVI